MGGGGGGMRVCLRREECMLAHWGQCVCVCARARVSVCVCVGGGGTARSKMLAKH